MQYNNKLLIFTSFSFAASSCSRFERLNISMARSMSGASWVVSPSFCFWVTSVNLLRICSISRSDASARYKKYFEKRIIFLFQSKTFFKYLAHITQWLKGLEQLTAPNHDASKGDPIKFHPQLKAHKAYVKLPSCSKSNDIFLSWLSILER